MANVTVKITGLEQLQKALTETQPKQARAAMRSALTVAANTIKQEMASQAPRDTGFLAEHFVSKISIREGGAVGTAYVGPQGKIKVPNVLKSGRHGRRGKWKVVRYASGRPVGVVAMFLEYGTRKMKANPFMSRAWMAKRETLTAQIIAKFKEVLGVS